MIRTYNTCEVNDIRAQTRRHRSRRCSNRWRWPISCARAREVRSELLQVRPTIVPARGRRLGRAAGAAAAVDRIARAGDGGAAAPADHSPPAGRRAGADDLASDRDRDDDQLHAAARERAVRARDAAAEVHVHDRRPQPRDLRPGPEHARGRHGRDDDRRQRARQRHRPAGLGGRRRRRSISCCSSNSPMLGGPTQTNKTMFGSLQLAADIRSDRDEVAPRVMSYKAPIAGSDIAAAAPAALRRDAAAERLQPRVRRRPADRDRSRSSSWRRSCRSATSCAGPRALQTLIPASEKDRLATHADRRSQQLEASLRQTYGSMPNTARLHEAGDAADLRQHQQRRR